MKTNKKYLFRINKKFKKSLISYENYKLNKFRFESIDKSSLEVDLQESFISEFYTISFQSKKFSINESIVIFEEEFDLVKDNQYFKKISDIEKSKIEIFKQLSIDHIIIIDNFTPVKNEIDLAECYIVNDHINLTGYNPLIGENNQETGDRFPDMSEVYNRETNDKLGQLQTTLDLKIVSGIGVAVDEKYLHDDKHPYLRDIGVDIIISELVYKAITGVHAKFLINSLCFKNSILINEKFFINLLKIL